MVEDIVSADKMSVADKLDKLCYRRVMERTSVILHTSYVKNFTALPVYLCIDERYGLQLNYQGIYPNILVILVSRILVVKLLAGSASYYSTPSALESVEHPCCRGFYPRLL